MKQFQRLGKALLFPIAVLPFAALLNRLGALFSYTEFGGPFDTNQWMWWIGKIIQYPGLVVFDNIALVFAIGVAFGFASDFRGECALVSAVTYLGLEALMGNLPGAPGVGLPRLFYGNVLTFNFNGHFYSQLLFTKGSHGGQGSPPINPLYSFTSGVFGAIVTAIIVAYLYNRYRKIELPRALSFFGGRRFIPMLGLATVIPLAFVFAALWPWVNYILNISGDYISNSGGTSSGLTARFFAIFTYGFLNRLAQPFGLHHILNTFLWFQLPITGGTLAHPHIPTTVNGDIPAFQKGVLTAGVFTTCFFPLFLGGLPGAATAMALTAEKSKRKEVALLLLGVGTVAFVTGIDEPVAFLFIFVSPVLWIVHCFLTATLCGITTLFNMHIGFGFSAGLIDYLVSLPTAWLISLDIGSIWSNPLWIWPLAVFAFALYLPIFYFLIKRMNVATPGRENLIAPGAKISKVYSFKEQEAPGEDDLKHDEISSDKKTIKKTATVKPVKTDHLTKAEKIIAKKAKKAKRSSRYDEMAVTLIEAIGKDNITILENCATRIRLVVKDASKIDKAKVKTVSQIGLIKLSNTAVQVVIGTDVEHVVDRMRNLL